jgi:hypothetical protein
MASAITQVTLRVEPGSEPISGQVLLPDGTETAFEGYVQLIAALEELWAASVPPEPTPPGAAAAPRT